MIKAVVFDCFGVLYVPGGWPRKLERNNDLLAYVARLRSWYSTAALSNLPSQRLDGYFTPSEEARYFDVVLTSGAAGVAKPHPSIYEQVCHKLGVAPNEAIMIDDSEDNCAGARAVGMQAVLYQSAAQLKRDLELLLEQNGD